MNTACPACGKIDYSEIDYPSPQKNLDFRKIAVCLSCGMGRVITSLSQSEINQIYDQGSYWEEVKINKLMETHFLTQSIFRVESILYKIKHKSELSVLDVGAGSGFMFEALKKVCPQEKFHYDFFEPDNQMANLILKRQLGNNSIHRVTTLESQKKYQIIFLNHVLEHVIDPVGFLVQLKSSLAPGGLLYIEVPHSDHHYKKDVFPHTLFFNAASLKMILQKAGLSTLSSRSFGNLTVEVRRNLFEKVINKTISMAQKSAIHFQSEFLNRKLNQLKFGYNKNRKKSLWLNAIATQE